MGRLFWKIFLWFWMAMIVTVLGVVWVMTQFLLPFEDQMQTPTIQRMSHQVEPELEQVMAAVQRGDLLQVKQQLLQISQFSPLTVLLIDSHGQELLGRLTPDSDTHQKNIIHQRQVVSNKGELYQLLVHLPLKSSSVFQRGFNRPFFVRQIIQRNPQLIVMRLGMAILLSGLVCFWLAWYLTHPVRQLREASYRLANGELDVRIAHKMGRRRDEIADLGKDFDHMAQRLQQIINKQKQLVQDVSHELRSPLARLQVAMGLARKKLGHVADDELLRIEQEANRLENLVSQILTIARLEENSAQRAEEYIDVAALLKQVVDDANFEAKDRSCEVILSTEIQPIIQANGELLHRAFENIVRNALKYTAENSLVSVALTAGKKESDWLQITICDNGEGVPEEQLPKLFDPFFRVAESRDRSSGGYGLGLAIANRAIHSHGGHMVAKNRDGKGLCVEIDLPMEV